MCGVMATGLSQHSCRHLYLASLTSSGTPLRGHVANASSLKATETDFVIRQRPATPPKSGAQKGWWHCSSQSVAGNQQRGEDRQQRHCELKAVVGAGHTRSQYGPKIARKSVIGNDVAESRTSAPAFRASPGRARNVSTYSQQIGAFFYVTTSGSSVLTGVGETWNALGWSSSCAAV